MCSICGIIDFKNTPEPSLVNKMGASMKNRGPDATESYCDDLVALHHNRLSVMDPENGCQPMTAVFEANEYTIIYNGEIYNSPDLRQELIKYGAHFRTACDTETVLWSYIIWGDKCPEKLNGIFAFCVYDKARRKLFMARDRLGVKPFFYTVCGSSFLFASEVKALLIHPNVSHKVDMAGLWQLIFLSPVTLPGSGIFRDIKELRPAECATFSDSGLEIKSYWSLLPKPWHEDAQTAAETVGALIADAAARQTVSDVPLCTFLSGGLDSSVLTALCQAVYNEKGMQLSTYSFEYEGNKENFKKSLFQPQGDDEYAVYLAEYLGTSHTVLTAPNREVAQCLLPATLARDFPGQADIDSSLLFFCNKVKERHTVALSGECADEIFGGYPWFYRPEMLHRDFFPWIHEPMQRAAIFKKEFAHPDEGYAFLSGEYKKILSSCPYLPEDSDSMRTSRIATCLSAGFFMTSLLERKDRMSMYSGLEVRVPFSDHRIIEYVYNVPWEIKFEGGVEKALLRNAAKSLLPDKILWRKKSPYPKTHSPQYRSEVLDMLKARLDTHGILSEVIDKSVLESVLSGEDRTWFGQLMSTPQLIAWLVQFDYWAEKYGVEFTEQ